MLFHVLARFVIQSNNLLREGLEVVVMFGSLEGTFGFQFGDTISGSDWCNTDETFGRKAGLD